VDQACQPLKALLHIMAHGHCEGEGLDSEAVRGLFSREAMLESDWYRQRLDSQQQADIAAWERHTAYLRAFLERQSHHAVAERMGLRERLAAAEQRLAQARSKDYREGLAGTIGRQPLPAGNGG
jgi:hypothetical protein